MYKECYSQSWVKSSDEHKKAYDCAQAAPSNMMILLLEIPSEFIMEVDRS